MVERWGKTGLQTDRPE